MRYVVYGEALIDFIQQKSGSFLPLAGGAPFNFAKCLAKHSKAKEFSVDYLNPVSTDQFGEKIYRELRESLVNIPSRSNLPTALALISVDDYGKPHYQFYRSQVADRDTNIIKLKELIPEDCCLFHTGGLALCPEDETFLNAMMVFLKERNITISIDVNVRIQAQSDVSHYLSTLRKIIQYADIIKVSDEDLGFLIPDLDKQEKSQKIECMEHHIQTWLNNGIKTVLLTLGSDGAYYYDKNNKIHVKAVSVENVVDSVGCGDVFYATFINQILSRTKKNRLVLDLVTAEMAEEALKYANMGAAINLEKNGCNPPSSEEIEAKL